MQRGFRHGRSCRDDMFTIQQLTDKRRQFNKDRHIAFVDYVKAFDKVNPETLWTV